MPPGAAKRILWVTLLFTLPVPFFMIEVGWVPPIRLILFALLTTAAAVSEPGFDTGFVAGLLVPQAFLYTALCYWLAGAAAVRLSRLVPAWLRLLAQLVLLGALVAGSLFPIFRTPFSHSAPRANLLGIFN
jgi:hypothetical protein